MGFPAAHLSDTTATGDDITGPGVPNVLTAGMPAPVSDNACTGSITIGSPTVLIGGRRAARVRSQVTGVNPFRRDAVTFARLASER
jgi:uncharacterized Zn-binding protein involved in type VI secretion